MKRDLATAARRRRLGDKMQPLRARVRNGRLVLDEATQLPEGQVIELVPLDEVLARGGDYLDDEERAALRRELEASVADVRGGGELVDAEEVLAELQALR